MIGRQQEKKTFIKVKEEDVVETDIKCIVKFI